MSYLLLKNSNRYKELPIYNKYNALYLLLLIIVIVMIIFILCYLDYPFPVKADQDSTQRPAIILNQVVQKKTSWEQIWENCATIKPDQNIISQLTAKLSDNERKTLTTLLKDGLSPLGDTFFMRRPHSLPAMDPVLIRRFQAVNLLSGKAKLSELRELAKTDNKVVKYRALLEIARFRFRRNKGEDLIKLLADLKVASAMSVPDQTWKSDVEFLLGHYYSITKKYGLAIEHLHKAIKLDPFFINARWALIRILLNWITSNNTSINSKDCLDVAAHILKNIEQIALLAQNRDLFIDIAVELENMTHYSPIKYLAIGYSLYFAGDNKTAHKWLDSAQKYSVQLPRHCEVEIKKKADWLIEKIKAL